MSAVTGGVPAELAGVEWTLHRYVRGGVSRERPRSPREVVLRFSDDGQLSGSDGCNYWGAQVSVRGSRLTVGSAVKTAVACPGIIELTDAVAAMFRGEVRWGVEDEVLTLTVSDGTLLVYERRASIFPSDRPGYPAGCRG